MNLFYFSTEPVPGTHGGSIHTWEVARHLANRGHSVTLGVPRSSGQAVQERIDGVRILRWPMRLFGKSAPVLAAPWAAAAAREPYDAVISRFSLFGGADALLAGLARAPLVAELNNPHLAELLQRIPGIPAATAVLSAWHRFLASRFDGAIAPSRSLLPSTGVPALITSWATNTGLFTPERRVRPEAARLREALELPDGAPVAIFTGSFRAWHGALRLPAILDLTLRKVPSARALLVGDGPEREAVRGEIARRGLSGRVRLTGARPYAEVADLCALSDVGLAPFAPEANPAFRTHGFYYSPFKLFEYLASGLPAVTVDLPPLCEIVADGVDGRIAPPGDDERFAEALAGLLEDPQARKRMGTAGREKAVRLYSWEAHVAKIEAFLIDLARPPDAGRSRPPARESRSRAGTRSSPSDRPEY